MSELRRSYQKDRSLEKASKMMEELESGLVDKEGNFVRSHLAKVPHKRKTGARFKTTRRRRRSFRDGRNHHTQTSRAAGSYNNCRRRQQKEKASRKYSPGEEPGKEAKNRNRWDNKPDGQAPKRTEHDGGSPRQKGKSGRTGGNLVVVEQKDPGMSQSVQRIFADKYPELLEMSGELATLENTMRMVVDNQVITKTKLVMKATPADTREGLWQAYEKARDAALAASISTMATHRLAEMDEDDTRKMLECIFRKNNIQVTLCKPIVTKPTMAQVLAGAKNTQKPRTQKTFATEAIEITKKGAGYKEVLKDIESTLGEKGRRQGIQTIRSTKNGSLLIILDSNAQNNESLQKAVKERNPDCRITGKGRKAQERRGVCFIRDMDETATREEVQTTLRILLGDPNNERGIEVGELRPSRNNTQTATVKAPNSSIEKALEMGSLQAGLSTGKIEARHDVKRCYRCWSYDHIARDCTEPDRRASCFKCGIEGHKSADCKGEVQCPICEKKGRMAGGKGCKSKQKAIQTARSRVDSTPATSRTSKGTTKRPPKLQKWQHNLGTLTLRCPQSKPWKK